MRVTGGLFVCEMDKMFSQLFRYQFNLCDSKKQMIHMFLFLSYAYNNMMSQQVLCSADAYIWRMLFSRSYSLATFFFCFVAIFKQTWRIVLVNNHSKSFLQVISLSYFCHPCKIKHIIKMSKHYTYNVSKYDASKWIFLWFLSYFSFLCISN